MTDGGGVSQLLSELFLLDTLLNISVFVFLGVIIWLYIAAPTGKDQRD